MTPHDLDLTVHGKQDSIHLNFTVKKLPMEGYFHTIHPQGKRGTFDVGYRAAFVEDRQRGIETPVLVPGNYASIRSGPMHLSLGSDGESISGAEDGCPFSGRIYGGHYYHKEITYLIKADCYVGGQFIAKGTRMTGVIFSATNIGSIYWNYPITDQVGHVIIVRSTVGEPRAVSFFIR